MCQKMSLSLIPLFLFQSKTAAVNNENGVPSPTKEVEVSSENVDKVSDTKSHPQVTDPKPKTESMIELESIQEKKNENNIEGARLECKNYFISLAKMEWTEWVEIF